jgi:hypothetical protein
MQTCPNEILDWLPWYADDALPAAQRGAVEAHAAQCAECRLELAMLAGEVTPAVDAPDPDAAFAKVLARIEAAEVGAETIAIGGSRVPAAAARRAPPRPSLQPERARRMPRMAMAAALFAVATAGWIARDLARHADAMYQTASGPAATVAGEAADQLDVVFRANAPIERINANLRALGGVVISGPSQAGRYRIALPAGSDAAAAAELLRTEETGVASFAEIVRP